MEGVEGCEWRVWRDVSGGCGGCQLNALDYIHSITCVVRCELCGGCVEA